MDIAAAHAKPGVTSDEIDRIVHEVQHNAIHRSLLPLASMLYVVCAEYTPCRLVWREIATLLLSTTFTSPSHAACEYLALCVY